MSIFVGRGLLCVSQTLYKDLSHCWAILCKDRGAQLSPKEVGGQPPCLQEEKLMQHPSQ